MQSFQNGLYWVMVRLIVNNQTSYDWAIGTIREGHFDWLNRYVFDGRQGLPPGVTLEKCSLQWLVENRIPMIFIEKPDLKPFMKEPLFNDMGWGI